jgi:hypothetical protein
VLSQELGVRAVSGDEHGGDDHQQERGGLVHPEHDEHHQADGDVEDAGEARGHGEPDQVVG